MEGGMMDVAFPVQLTAAPPPQVVVSSSSLVSSSAIGGDGDGGGSDDLSNASDAVTNMTITLPELFRENIDQTSVTTPEALTFLQLLNNVNGA